MGTQNAPKAVFLTPKVPKSGQCSRKSGHFFRELSLSVHGRDGLSRPFPRLVRGSNEVGGA